jgi:transcriptional regulator with XRE-family HTH domain
MSLRSSLYSGRHHAKDLEELVSKKAAESTGESFGRRMARLRKAAGYTQRGLAPKLGISQRMVAYYEAQTEHPPAALLPRLAELLHVSSDQLLGLQTIPRDHKPHGARLWRRFQQIEQLPAKEQRDLIKLIDLFLDRERSKAAAGAGR